MSARGRKAAAPGQAQERALQSLFAAIASDDRKAAKRCLADAPTLATASAGLGATRDGAQAFYLEQIAHYVYAGDTALHVAAAAHRPDVVRELVAKGADVGARNRRGAQPLHYACDGVPGSDGWNPNGQYAVVKALVDAGADPNALDKSGVTPLHRAVRTRCSEAVRALLESGADARLRNKSGSTPVELASQPTGRGGSGSAAARDEQQRILRLLAEAAPRAGRTTGRAR